MRHALILRALRLPLIAALGMYIALVAMTAYSQYPAEPAPGRSGQRPTGDALGDTELLAVSQASPAEARPDALMVLNQGDEERVETSSDCQEDLPLSDDPAVPTSTESALSPPATGHSRLLDFDTLMASCPDGTAASRLWIRGTWYAALPSDESFDTTSLTVTTAHTLSVAVPDRATELTPSADDADRTTADAEGPATAASTGVRDEPISLRNAPENRYPVTYLLDGQIFELKPGEEAVLAAGQATIRFDRGGGIGTVTRDVLAGRYEFRLSASGWELQPAAR